MTPYYDDGTVTIYHGDARDWSGSADVLITDPPYGVGLVTKTTKHGKARESSVLYRDDPEHVRELIASIVVPLLAMCDRALIFPGSRMMFAYPEPAAIGSVFMPNGAGRCSWGFQTSHPILFYGRDPFLVDGQGSRPNGFRDHEPNREEYDHPCPKPLPWMRWAVSRTSRPGETVLDPFAGVGTTLRAAKDHGRRAIGIELEERYCEQAALRCAQEVFALTG